MALSLTLRVVYLGSCRFSTSDQWEQVAETSGRMWRSVLFSRLLSRTDRLLMRLWVRQGTCLNSQAWCQCFSLDAQCPLLHSRCHTRLVALVLDKSGPLPSLCFLQVILVTRFLFQTLSLGVTKQLCSKTFTGSSIQTQGSGHLSTAR